MWRRLDIYKEIRDAMTEDEILERLEFRYELHNAMVRQYFSNRPDDLLEICLAENTDLENWTKLMDFLGAHDHSLQGQLFPYENRAPLDQHTLG